ncbi:MAG TPA: hypothetical protein VGA75_13195 [Paracoccaceae bacterium]
MRPQRRLGGRRLEGAAACRTPFETRKPEFGGAIGRGIAAR